jgi:hypothetical protein
MKTELTGKRSGTGNGRIKRKGPRKRKEIEKEKGVFQYLEGMGNALLLLSDGSFLPAGGASA